MKRIYRSLKTPVLIFCGCIQWKLILTVSMTLSIYVKLCGSLVEHWYTSILTKYLGFSSCTYIQYGTICDYLPVERAHVQTCREAYMMYYSIAIKLDRNLRAV